MGRWGDGGMNFLPPAFCLLPSAFCPLPLVGDSNGHKFQVNWIIYFLEFPNSW
ncbi:MAG: hypothetical protein F6K16_05320 [Symploca sp. SIO2B6]|nr:hypothetical protein [Symploca sp. SIO2B6]